MDKLYTVYFIIKKRGHGLLGSIEVKAQNKKAAFELVEAEAQKKYHRHAFCKTTTAPIFNKNGSIEFQSMIYSRAFVIDNVTYLY